MISAQAQIADWCLSWVGFNVSRVYTLEKYEANYFWNHDMKKKSTSDLKPDKTTYYFQGRQVNVLYEKDSKSWSTYTETTRRVLGIEFDVPNRKTKYIDQTFTFEVKKLTKFSADTAILSLAIVGLAVIAGLTIKNAIPVA